MHRSSIFLVSVLLVSPVTAPAQTKAVPVELVGQSADSVGQRLVYHVREGLRRSAAFRLTDMKEARWKIIITTMPRVKETPELATIYAVIWTLAIPAADGSEIPPYYVHSDIGYTGTDVLQQAADGIVASSDRLISEMRQTFLRLLTR